MNAAETARANAIHCEAKKHAYRQTQDGVVVSFVLHPHEVPDGLATAALGTRYMLALVAIGDDEQPVEPPTTAGGRHEVSNPTASPRPAPAQSGGAKRSWAHMSAAQQAGIRCNEPAFRRFLAETSDCTGIAMFDLDMAVAEVRDRCGVVSRSDIDELPKALSAWRALDDEFQRWMRQPEVVG